MCLDMCLDMCSTHAASLNDQEAETLSRRVPLSMGAAMTIDQQVHASCVPTELPRRARVPIRRGDMAAFGDADGKADDSVDDARMEPNAP